MSKTPFPIHLINPQAIEVCRILHNSNYQAYIVGGCVRDLLLGVQPKDWDICTNALPEKVMELFPKNYPTGLQHGTVTVAMGEGVENHFEVTTFRVEGKYLDGRRPEEVSFVKSVEEDLGRRDLTINAMAYNPITNHLSDPYDGLKDLENGIIKAVGDANLRFQEDGLRIMRVARFAARFGYQVEQSTIEGMANNLETLKKVSKERVKDELCKTLMAKNPSVGLRLLASTGVLKIASPLLEHAPFLNYFEFKGELETRLARIYSIYDVESVSEELKMLKFSNKEINRVVFMVKLLNLFVEIEENSEWQIPKYKQFIAFIKNKSLDSYEYSMSQFLLLNEYPGSPTKSTLELYNSKAPIVFSRKEMQINGEDLIALGIDYGLQIKHILDKCYERILESPELNTKEMLTAIALNERDALIVGWTIKNMIPVDYKG
jgi:tRNA nucleotidyltransferase (CCA-adding enzyme)